MDVKEFSEFVEENISKILDIPHPRYPLNRDKVGEWIDRHSDDWKDRARLVSNLFQNVSWDEFLDGMNKVANELGMYREALYLHVPFKNRAKSNFFATVLFFYIFCHKQGHSFRGIYQFGMDIPENSIVVIVDDASYSGVQIYNTAIDVGIYNKKKVFLAIPYISEKARRRLKHDNVVIPTTSKTFHTLQTYLGDRAEDVVRECTFIEDKHGLYFDFKLPDYVSIFTATLSYGFTLDQISKTEDCGGNNLWKTNNNLCLIDGCEAVYSLRFPTTDRLYLSDYVYTCPNSFYKEIMWTFRGHDLASWLRK